MPLVWAHSEYVKLRRSSHDGRVFDTPPQTVQRYQLKKTGSSNAIWRFNHKCRTITRGKTLRLEVLAPAMVHWSADYWRTAKDTQTRDNGLGVHVADLPSNNLPAGGMIIFTIYWPEQNRWEGVDYSVIVSNR
jgi:glucoamylase